MVSGLEPSGHPLCVTHEQTTLITCKNMYRAGQLLKQPGEVLAVR
jgi:hypothetical protein